MREGQSHHCCASRLTGSSGSVGRKARNPEETTPTLVRRRYQWQLGWQASAGRRRQRCARPVLPQILQPQCETACAVYGGSTLTRSSSIFRWLPASRCSSCLLCNRSLALLPGGRAPCCSTPAHYLVSQVREPSRTCASYRCSSRLPLRPTPALQPLHLPAVPTHPPRSPAPRRSCRESQPIAPQRQPRQL